jgi:hypothetical protein
MLPIRCSHVDSLFAMQQMETSIQMQAKRANRSWAIEVCQILCNLTDHAVLKKVRLPCLYLDGVATAAQQEGAHIFFRACLCTAGQRFWSMSLHSEIPPDTFSGILDDDVQEAFACLERSRRLATVVDKATLCAANPDHPERKARCMSCLGVHHAFC